MRRLRQFLESIVFAGLKPDARAGVAGRFAWWGAIRNRIDRFVSGAAPSDPLYLSNRTFAQKARSALIVVVPVLLVAGFMVLALSDVFTPAPAPKAEPKPGEIAAKLLPNLENNITLVSNKDVEVVEARIEHGPSTKLVGTVKNNTPRVIHEANLVFDLTDMMGSQVGAVSTKVDNLAPGAVATFQLPIQQSNAQFVLVREVHTQ